MLRWPAAVPTQPPSGRGIATNRIAAQVLCNLPHRLSHASDGHKNLPSREHFIWRWKFLSIKSRVVLDINLAPPSPPPNPPNRTPYPSPESRQWSRTLHDC